MRSSTRRRAAAASPAVTGRCQGRSSAAARSMPVTWAASHAASSKALSVPWSKYRSAAVSADSHSSTSSRRVRVISSGRPAAARNKAAGRAAPFASAGRGASFANAGRGALAVAGAAAVLLLELADPSGSVDDLLLAGIEGMAGRADLHVQLLVQGRARLEGVAAGAHHLDLVILGMNAGFHGESSGVCGPRRSGAVGPPVYGGTQSAAGGRGCRKGAGL